MNIFTKWIYRGRIIESQSKSILFLKKENEQLRDRNIFLEERYREQDEIERDVWSAYEQEISELTEVKARHIALVRNLGRHRHRIISNPKHISF